MKLFFLKIKVLSLCILILILSVKMIYADQEQLVQGAGPSTKAVDLFFKHFSKQPEAQGYIFKVAPRSIKHAGGIKASSKYLFGRSGRPLTEGEKKLGKYECFLAMQPIRMVTGDRVGIKTITLKTLEQILSRKIVNWQDVKGANARIFLVGREPTEAAFEILKAQYPIFRLATFDKIFKRDHQVVNFIKSKKGKYAIAFGIGKNFKKKYLLDVVGFEAGIKLGLIIDVKNRHNPVVAGAEKYAKSKGWKEILLKAGITPIL